jgi:hypothetical protein
MATHVCPFICLSLKLPDDSSLGWDVMTKAHTILSKAASSPDTRIYATRSPYWMEEKKSDVVNKMAFNMGDRLENAIADGWFVDMPTTKDMDGFIKAIKSGINISAKGPQPEFTWLTALEQYLTQRSISQSSPSSQDESSQSLSSTYSMSQSYSSPESVQSSDLSHDCHIEDQKAIAECLRGIWNMSSPQKLEEGLKKPKFYMLKLISRDDKDDGQIEFFDWDDLKASYANYLGK